MIALFSCFADLSLNLAASLGHRPILHYKDQGESPLKPLGTSPHGMSPWYSYEPLLGQSPRTNAQKWLKGYVASNILMRLSLLRCFTHFHTSVCISNMLPGKFVQWIIHGLMGRVIYCCTEGTRAYTTCTNIVRKRKLQPILAKPAGQWR